MFIVYLTKASGGILFCLCNSVNAKPALSKFQLVSSRHLKKKKNKLFIKKNLQTGSKQGWGNRDERESRLYPELKYSATINQFSLLNIHWKFPYFLLHSMFIWVSCEIAWIICSLVASSGAELPLTAATIGWTGGTADVIVLVTGVGCGIGVLNAVLTWARVNVLIWSISFFIQKPLPIGTMTSDRWNERISCSLERDDDGDSCVDFSRKTPVTVKRISERWKYEETDYH